MKTLLALALLSFVCRPAQAAFAPPPTPTGVWDFQSKYLFNHQISSTLFFYSGDFTITGGLANLGIFDRNYSSTKSSIRRLS